jgi:anaerobic ribonucleoside-triphosphate reductase activating protein
MIYKNVKITKPDDMSDEEATIYLEQQYQSIADELDNRIAEIIITLEHNEVVLKGKQKNHIRRVRRVTGYLSQSDNFNPSKSAELAARQTHISIK